MAITKQRHRGSSIVGALVGAVLGGLISLGVVFISFGRQTVHVENLMTAVNGANGKGGPDGLKARVSNLDERVEIIETTPHVQGSNPSPQAIRREIEAFCAQYPERCGATEVEQLRKQVNSLQSLLDTISKQSGTSLDGSSTLQLTQMQTQLDSVRTAVEHLANEKHTNVTDAQLQGILDRLSAIEQDKSIMPVLPENIRVVKPGQLLLDEDAVTFHLKKSDRKSSNNVRVELQLVPKRDVRVAFHTSSSAFIRAVDMQGREYLPDPYTYAGKRQAGADLRAGTVVALVLNFDIPSEENTIRTIKMHVRFDNSDWQDIETPVIAIGE